MSTARKLRKPPHVPSYRLHKPSGQAVVTLDGRDLYLGKHGTEASHAEYNRLVQEWLANGRRLPCADEPGSMTIAALVDAYWCHVREYYRKNGRATPEVGHQRHALLPLEELYGHTPVREFGPRRLMTVREVHVSHGLARHTVNGYVRRIKQCFRWGVACEMVPPSVLQALDAVPGLRKGRTTAAESKPVKPVPEAHIRAVEPHVSRQVGAMIRLQELTGMRPGEVVIMRSIDIDTTGSVWVYRPESHKTEHHGRERIIPLGPKAQQIVGEFLKADVSAYLFSPAEAEAERYAALREQRETPVQPSQRLRSKQRAKRAERGRRKRPPGDRYDTPSYRRAIERACKQAGVPTWSPDQLRHTAATRIRKKHGIEMARVLLGHSSTITTEVYAEADLEAAQRIMAQDG